MFKVGDRIRARVGIRPGSYGSVTSLRRDYPASDILNVIYDCGTRDTIYGRMLELIEPATEYDMD